MPFVGGNLLIHACARRQVVIVHAHLRERRAGATGTGETGGEPQHREVQVDADSYEQGRDEILAGLDDGWIVAGFRVER